MVSINPEGRHDCPTRKAGAVASGRDSSLLVLEIELAGRRPRIEMELHVLIRQ
jgi:hypothetical protein